ncbi:uncharacterized protein LOC117895115 isoform X2 [Drosophila subobscura]|uniref:uncharacterized protein LOC117895115 isoform X2 n=1 Tax=Drosophila subobscura TaxID=7241 RepID=UPI00155A65EA|nr:uncharacterized protein LOC117895115 isoform X2 [Drosophila subobscura]
MGNWKIGCTSGVYKCPTKLSLIQTCGFRVKQTRWAQGLSEMESIVSLLGIVLLIIGLSAYPQAVNELGGGNSWLESSQQRPPSEGSTTTPQPTTQSPQYLACLQSCPATSEYNPICGSDNVNYYNVGKFDCAVRCGQNVRRIHLGACRNT